MGQRWLDGYSAAVEIYLLVDGKRLNVAQIGRGSLILRDAVKIPPSTHAKLVVKIDGHEEVDNIFLADGAQREEQVVPYF